MILIQAIKKMNLNTLLLVSSLVLTTLILPGADATELGIQGTQFTLNGKPTFLFGISYYGALGASDALVRRDLEDMRQEGFNWIRVWATWSAFNTDLSAVNVTDGKPRKPFFDRLERLMAECDRRGMVVDITLARGDGLPPNRLETQEQHRRVVMTLVKNLKSSRNWYLDISNERNIRDKRFTSIEDLRQIRDDVKQADAARLVTASHGGDIGSDDLRDYVVRAQLDFVAPHRPRDANSPGQTEATTRLLLDWMKQIGRSVPVHYQEPFRRGYTEWQPKAENYVTDALGAKAGGAAGWCFHNGSEKGTPENKPRRSFDLREKRLFDQLDAEERRALELLRILIVHPDIPFFASCD